MFIVPRWRGKKFGEKEFSRWGGQSRIELQNDERIATQRKMIRITEAGIIYYISLD